MIGLRHEIEHQMTNKIDDYVSAKFQACCLNFNHYIKIFFGNHYGIDKYLAFSLQLSSISEEQSDELTKIDGLPKNIQRFDGVSGRCLRFSRGTEGSVKGLILDGSIISLSHPLLGQHQGQR